MVETNIDLEKALDRAEEIQDELDGVGPRDTEPTALDFPGLSPRQRQVAIGLALGKRNAEIAAELGVSTKTVDTHRGHVMSRLKVSSNVALARLAIREGWVSAYDNIEQKIDEQLITVGVPSGDQEN